MQIKCYFKKTWSIVYLLAGVLFSFRGCFQRHVSFEARQESDQLLAFFNDLDDNQQAILLEVCQKFSPEEQRQLEAMVEGLSGQDLNMLKEIFGQDASGPQAGGSEQLRVMIAALLKAGYSSHELKSLITDFQQGNFESPAINKFLNALDAAIAERSEETAAPAPPRLPSPAEQAQNQSDWEKQFTKLGLSNTVKEDLRTILGRYEASKKPLLELLKHANADRRIDFLTSLVELSSSSRQDQLLKVIIYVNNKAPELAVAICEGKIKDIKTAKEALEKIKNLTWSAKLQLLKKITSNARILLNFQMTLQAKEKQRDSSPNTQKADKRRKSSAMQRVGEQEEIPSEKSKATSWPLWWPFSKGQH